MQKKYVSCAANIKQEHFELPFGYRSLQSKLRMHLKSALRRNNGTLTEQDFRRIFSHVKKVDKLMLRLCKKLPHGQLEWKPEINTIEDLIKKVGNKDNITEEIKAVFRGSKYMYNRSDYQFIVPANKTRQIKSLYDFHGPVYGFDILIRPMTEFLSEKQIGEHKNDLHIGSNSFAVVIHASLTKEGQIDKSEPTLIRYVAGQTTANYSIIDLMQSNFSFNDEFKVVNNLAKGNIEDAVRLITKVANESANNTLQHAGP